MSSRRYADRTAVPVEKSRTEIEATLRRYGADQFLYGEQTGQAIIGFRMKGRQIKITLELPVGKKERDLQERRRLFRALAMVVKAKLEAVASGIALFEDEFLAYTVMPDGQTVGHWARPQLESAYKLGKMPPLLPKPN